MVKDLNIVEAEFCSPEMARFLECAVKAGCSIVIGGDDRAGKTTLVQYLSASISKEHQVIGIDSDGDLNLDFVNPGWKAYIYMAVMRPSPANVLWIECDKGRTQLLNYLIESSEEIPSVIIYNETPALISENISFIAHSPCNSQFIFEDFGSPLDVAWHIQTRAELHVRLDTDFDNNDIWTNERENPFNKIDIIVTLRGEPHCLERCAISDISVIDKQQSKVSRKCVLIQLFKANWTRDGVSFETTKDKIPADLAQKLKEAGYVQS